MPVCGCSSGLAASALAALVLLPVPYLLPELALPAPPAAPALGPAPRAPRPPRRAPAARWLDVKLAPPALDVLLAGLLLLLALAVFLCEWIQRKLLHRRITKLHGFVGGGAERLRAREAQREQLQATRRTVRAAASEYRLLLYLLLQRAPRPPCPPPAASDALFEKEFPDDPFFLAHCAKSARGEAALL